MTDCPGISCVDPATGVMGTHGHCNGCADADEYSWRSRDYVEKVREAAQLRAQLECMRVALRSIAENTECESCEVARAIALLALATSVPDALKEERR